MLESVAARKPSIRVARCDHLRGPCGPSCSHQPSGLAANVRGSDVSASQSQPPRPVSSRVTPAATSPSNISPSQHHPFHRAQTSLAGSQHDRRCCRVESLELRLGPVTCQQTFAFIVWRVQCSAARAVARRGHPAPLLQLHPCQDRHETSVECRRVALSERPAAVDVQRRRRQTGHDMYTIFGELFRFERKNSQLHQMPSSASKLPRPDQVTTSTSMNTNPLSIDTYSQIATNTHQPNITRVPSE
jgi:hypothetical protein